MPESTAASLLEAEASAELRLLLRCTLGELAVLAGGAKPCVLFAWFA